MTKLTGKNSKGRKPRKDMFPEIRKILGQHLRKLRQEDNFSLDDIAFMSNLSKSAVWNVEEGISYDIDQYMEYASTLGRGFYTLFKEAMITYSVGPRLALPPDRLARINLTAKIKDMIPSTEWFKEETTVEQIATLLIEKKGIEKNSKLSSSISTILGNWVKEGLLESRKVRNINYYRFRKPIKSK
ncbi:helix-turn-helix domain-containing protein [Sphingobacterium sp. BIGb0116]|uniref:helix-turn-helix domain-containing protein n=1 Tax=Sphingobacterium sp. BIGb0116 TaxID=2940619 RepID=UPI0021693E00|nr:helix-turn-helix domain-containing protein [Sphingobacterium sp. BIGb0116]MCS4167646.1 transcriptional regulator with XRE-family HTH domain [Sphingobacterium sp. BIGb0116]